MPTLHQNSNQKGHWPSENWQGVSALECADEEFSEPKASFATNCNLILIANIVTTSKALVTRSDALVRSFFC